MTLQTYLQPDGSIDFDEELSNIIDRVPVGVYIPQYSMSRGIYLTPTNNFFYLPEYYLLDKFEDYVLQSFKSSSKSIGALYLGLKGSGKTKRAQKLALDSGMPILYLQDLSILNKSEWNNIIGTNIFDNWVVFIDEYEKKLQDETSVALLNWLDGSIATKQLFILIGNEKANNKFSNPLIDRLSRILWRKSFDTLQEKEVTELVNKLSLRTNKEELIESIANIPVISLDNTLQIIKTTNQFLDAEVSEIITMLNIEFKPYDEYVICDDKEQRVTWSTDTIYLAINKNKLKAKDDNLCVSFLDSVVEKYCETNKDINPIEGIYIDSEYRSLRIQYVSRGKYKIQLPYFYTSLETKTIKRSEELITLFLIKEDQYKLSSLSKQFITF